ncbi:hypothetical protein ERO13_A07G001050v2 [Gossypium hirsutum]|nr:hypothetical protein ERO13_A07G001050v2 [Gossypium hirsutum]
MFKVYKGLESFEKDFAHANFGESSLHSLSFLPFWCLSHLLPKFINFLLFFLLAGLTGITFSKSWIERTPYP